MTWDFLEEIKSHWESYIHYGEVHEGVSPMIRSSWRRCREAGVDPYGGTGRRLQEAEFDQIMKANRELIDVAKPIMENLNSLVLGTGFVLVLTDRNGVILHVIGEKSVEDEAKSLNFCPGSSWVENEVGTNAIGTCLVEKTPIQTIGAEHFCIEHHPWTCSAAPIRGDDGDIIGVLDMSGYCLGAHKHTLGIVVAAAYSIQNQLSLKKSFAILDTTIESMSDGMMIVDENFSIQRINKAGDRILEIRDGQLNGRDIRELLGEHIFRESDAFSKRVDWDFTVQNKKIPCNVKIAPIEIERGKKGMAILFREMKDVHQTVNVVSGNKAIYTFDNILTQNPKMIRAIREAQKFAKTRGCVLLEGESGTGKELFAHAIHNHSSRRDGPFVAINCASIPKDLVESELFGYEKGAFTGAVREGKIGKFELANGGTLFLDEIGELPLDLQAKLLRVLDDFTVTRVGGKTSKKLDVRMIVATNRDLFEETRRKTFREDLYYRLNVFNVKVPPLRERGEDAAILAEHFVQRLNLAHRTDKKISGGFLKSMEGLDWKGNVRELENTIHRAYHLCDGNVIGEDLLPDDIYTYEAQEDTYGSLSIKDQERDIIERALKKANGHVINAGDMIGLSKSAMYRKLKEHSINPKTYK
ncbi:MAG: sigma-54-dependent Fis family transcriptional regulator, partial [Gudongella sp.]|nr:sigma-54-dependent Fis family transcriptional regulator [Gudongella sp.]